MNKLISIFLLVILISCYNVPQGNNISLHNTIKKTDDKFIELDYRLLSKDTLKYFQYANSDMAKTKTILEKDGEDYEQYLSKIGENYQINVCNYTPQKPDFKSSAPYATHDRDYIQIGKHKFIFDNILFGNEYKNEYPLNYSLQRAYNFEFDNKKYFVAFFINAFMTTRPDYLITLFDMTQKENPLLILSEKQFWRDIHCLGDFNQDGRLDYAQYSGKNELICKTLNKNNYFETMKDYYLIIRHTTKHEIDLKNSKWFFDLDEK
jgi:hypothetical protein